MNRRGFVSLTWLFIIMIVIMALVMAQHGFDSNSEEQLINALNWSKVGQNVTDSIQNSIDGASEEWIKVVLSIAQKAVDFFGYTIMELGKLAARVAMDNPDIINYKVLFGLLVLSLIAPIIFPLFTIIVSIILIIKEWYINRREKKALKLLQEKIK